MNTTIQTIHAREILDSRGYPTVEVNVILQDGSKGRATSAHYAGIAAFKREQLAY